MPRKRHGLAARLVIERNREMLGRCSAGAVEKRADEISSASYLAFIRAVEIRADNLGALDALEKALAVKSTAK